MKEQLVGRDLPNYGGRREDPDEASPGVSPAGALRGQILDLGRVLDAASGQQNTTASCNSGSELVC
jgi:hypothetical protein